MKRLLLLAVFAATLAGSARLARAGFTETLPRSTFLLDVSWAHSVLDSAWDDHGQAGPLVDPIVRYEPGGGAQGTLIPNADVTYDLILLQAQYGVWDWLSLGVGVPVVARTAIAPSFGWVPGDYQPSLGRAYSQEDFWAWAASMGQPKPGAWSGNRGVLGDVVLGARLRFGQWLPWLARHDLSAALLLMGALPTGRQADPEEVIGAGTTMWDLHAQGDLGAHLSLDKRFRRELDDRLTLGVEAFYEALLPHRYRSPTGQVNPLLNNLAPHIGTAYVLDPGDFLGGSLQADLVPWRGPARGTWLTGGDAGRAAGLPPLLALSARYTFTWLFQSRWHSNSEWWDYRQEDRWRPGYKNIVTLSATVSLLRLGVPVQLYAAWRSLTWLPGRNTRAADVLTLGVRLPVKLW